MPLNLINNVTGEIIQSGWSTYGGKLHGRIQQLHVRVWSSKYHTTPIPFIMIRMFLGLSTMDGFLRLNIQF